MLLIKRAVMKKNFFSSYLLIACVCAFCGCDDIWDCGTNDVVINIRHDQYFSNSADFSICNLKNPNDTIRNFGVISVASGDSLVLEYVPNEKYRDYDYVTKFVLYEYLYTDEEFDSLYAVHGGANFEWYLTVDSVIVVRPPYRAAYIVPELEMGNYSFQCAAVHYSNSASISDYGAISICLE